LSKFMIRIVPLLAVLLLAGANQANAQGFSGYFGVGSAFDSAGTSSGCPSQNILDPFTGNCEPSASMGGVFGVFGADFMVKPHLGINGEYSFRFAQSNYLPVGGINARPAFYDFNAIYQPTSGDAKFVPVIEGGIGGAKVSFYATQQTSIFNQSQFFVSSSHFQVHGAVGVKWYFRGDAFIKPQVDLRYVPNLTDQYGRSFVPEVTVSVGYSFGRQ
jgi:outer membrane protein with beta-barrel domain